MNITWKSVVLSIAVAFTASFAMGQDVMIEANFSGDGGITAVDGSWRTVDAGVIGAEASLEGGYTFDLTLDSAADLLVVDAQLTVETGSVYNDLNPAHALNDHAAPNPALLAVPGFETLNADLWVTTPGAGTSAASSTSLAAGEVVSHFDTSDDGAQSGFHFASVTLIPENGVANATLDATIQTAATPTPLFDEVSVQLSVGTAVPEPASIGLVITALLGGLGLIRRKR